MISDLFNESALIALADERNGIEPPLHVTRYDNDTRFLVRSQDPRKKAQHYLVDLSHPTFPKGWCECDDFGFRKEGKIRRKQRPFKIRCKHIECVLSELAHARALCEAAELEFSAKLIPTLAEYEHRN